MWCPHLCLRRTALEGKFNNFLNNACFFCLISTGTAEMEIVGVQIKRQALYYVLYSIYI